jgi:hypothetical protein
MRYHHSQVIAPRSITLIVVAFSAPELARPLAYKTFATRPCWVKHFSPMVESTF